VGNNSESIDPISGAAGVGIGAGIGIGGLEKGKDKDKEKREYPSHEHTEIAKVFADD
jgi:hypothetical protein